MRCRSIEVLGKCKLLDGDAFRAGKDRGAQPACGYSVELEADVPPNCRDEPDRADQIIRRGGSVVKSTALEMRRAGNRTVGSNPTLSAILVLGPQGFFRDPLIFLVIR